MYEQAAEPENSWGGRAFSRQEIRGGLDTDLLKTVTGGLQFGYSINDARHLSRRTSQIFVLLSLQLSLYAGDYR